MSLDIEVPHVRCPSLGVLMLTLNLALFLPQTINRTPPYVLAGTGGGSMLGDVNISAILDSFSVGYDKRVRPNYGGRYWISCKVWPNKKSKKNLCPVSLSLWIIRASTEKNKTKSSNKKTNTKKMKKHKKNKQNNNNDDDQHENTESFCRWRRIVPRVLRVLLRLPPVASR